MKARITTVRLMQETAAQYETEGGQRMIIRFPRGTKLTLPLDWIYNGVPAEEQSTHDLLAEE